MPITGTTQLLGVIGDPVAHSLSPVMHNAALELWLQRPVPVATMRQALVNGLDKR